MMRGSYICYCEGTCIILITPRPVNVMKPHCTYRQQQQQQPLREINQPVNQAADKQGACLQ
jgi:hypothetical protein